MENAPPAPCFLEPRQPAVRRQARVEARKQQENETIPEDLTTPLTPGIP